MPVIECDNCGKMFDRKPSQMNTENYCCRACFLRAKGRINEERPCEHCGTVFRPKRVRENQRFCSKRCADLAKMRSPQDSPQHPTASARIDADAYAAMHGGYGLSSSYYPFLSW